MESWEGKDRDDSIHILSVKPELVQQSAGRISELLRCLFSGLLLIFLLLFFGFDLETF